MQKFTTLQFLHIPAKNRIKTKAYNELRRAAQRQYAGDIDIKNIVITGGFSIWEALYTAGWGTLGAALFIPTEGTFFAVAIPAGLICNFQKLTATGDVVSLSDSGGRADTFQASHIDNALENAAETLIDSMPRNATIAILSIYSENREIAEYVIDELEYKLVDTRKFQIVDRRRLEQIRQEQNFQMSEDVDDSSAISIGSMLGAGIVITGNISGSGSSRRLVLKALDVKTAQILTMTRERF